MLKMNTRMSKTSTYLSRKRPDNVTFSPSILRHCVRRLGPSPPRDAGGWAPRPVPTATTPFLHLLDPHLWVKKKSQASTEGRHEGMVSSINQWGHKPWGASHCPAAILKFHRASPGSAEPLSCRVFPGIIYQLAQVTNSVGIPLDPRLLLYRNNQQDELRGCNVTLARKLIVCINRLYG